MLVLAAEDYLAGNPAQDPDGPHYLSYYTDALDANGVGYDVYDVDRMGHQAPDALGVLSHYDAVIWYTGDDYLTRRPGQPPGTGTARLAVEEMIAVRAFLNEGGKLLYTGKRAGLQYAEGNEFRNFGFPEPDGTPGDAIGANVLRPAVLQQERDGQGPEHAGVRHVARVRRERPDAVRRLHHSQRRLPPVLPGGVHLRERRQHGRSRPTSGYFPFNMTGDGEPFERPDVGLRRDRGRQPGPHRHVRGHQLAARPAAVPDVRRLEEPRELAASGRRAVQPVQRPVLHGLERAQRRLQAAGQDHRPHRQDRAAS